MELQTITDRVKEIKKLCAQSDKSRLGRDWDRGDYVKAFAADVGALVKLTMGKDGLRDIENLDEKLSHELADCLYSIIIIADKYGVDLEKAFTETMKELENRASKNELAKSHSLWNRLSLLIPETELHRFGKMFLQ